MIEFKNMSFSYENEEGFMEGVANIDLTINDGEFVVLAGGSGCGKTTLTRLINGLIPECYNGKLEGEIRLDGLDPTAEKAVKMSAYVGSVFQNPKSQFFNVNSTNELAFPLENRAVPKEKILDKLAEATEMLDLHKLINRNMFRLSGGEKQKIALASVFMSDQKVVVLDEPSSNLDMTAIRELRKTLEIWKRAGKTIIIAEHRLFFLRELADKLILMKDGEIRKIYSGEEIRTVTDTELHEYGVRGFATRGLKRDRQISDEGEVSVNIKSMEFTYPGSDNGVVISELKLDKGRVAAIIGHNGAGKSTFIRCLAGLEKKAAGQIEVDGGIIKPSEMTEHCAMVMQDVNYQLFTESVEKELMFELTRSSLSKEEQQKELEARLERMQLTKERKSHPMAVSGGQKQRVAIICASLSEKSIIFFDEPTSGLDYINMRRVADSICELADQGRTVILITHDLELLMHCCDSVILIEDGELREHYQLDDINAKKLEDWFNAQL